MHFNPCKEKFGARLKNIIVSKFLSMTPRKSANACTPHQYYSADRITRNEIGGHMARKGESRGAHMVLVGTSEGKRHLGRPRRRWEENIEMDLQEIE
jgi:transposase